MRGYTHRALCLLRSMVVRVVSGDTVDVVISGAVDVAVADVVECESVVGVDR